MRGDDGLLVAHLDSSSARPSEGKNAADTNQRASEERHQSESSNPTCPELNLLPPPIPLLEGFLDLQQYDAVSMQSARNAVQLQACCARGGKECWQVVISK
jgi:hypothetical protein